jgi:hypothetical protein
MCEYSLNARRVIHCQIQSGDGTVAPTDDGYFLDVQMIEQGNGIHERYQLSLQQYENRAYRA